MTEYTRVMPPFVMVTTTSFSSGSHEKGVPFSCGTPLTVTSMFAFGSAGVAVMVFVAFVVVAA